MASLMLVPKTIVTISLAVVFVVLAVLHVIWAFSSGTLAQAPTIPTIDGEPTLRPSSLMTLSVAVALFAAALVVLIRGDLLFPALPSALSTWACVGLGGVFVLRAIGEFRLVGFFKSVRNTDFALWDTWLYSPLCLALGLGALWLATTPRAK